MTLFIQDHIAEVFEKWSNIEDEIWAKVSVKLTWTSFSKKSKKYLS